MDKICKNCRWWERQMDECLDERREHFVLCDLKGETIAFGFDRAEMERAGETLVDEITVEQVYPHEPHSCQCFEVK